MTISAVPLPGIRSLLQAATARASTGEPWRLNDRPGQVTQVYWRGSFALAAGIEAVIRATGADRVTVWFPGYFCNEALGPLRRLPVNLRFYPVQADLTPDWLALEERGEGRSGVQVFVLVHYFGFPNATFQAKAFCEEYDLVLLEDSAHVLRPGGGIGHGNLSIYSPWKLLAVPSSGILVAFEEWAANLAEVPPNQRGRRDTIRWLAKRLTQKLLVQFHVPWHLMQNVRLKDSTPSDTAELSAVSPEGCVPLDLKLLTVMGREMDDVMERRRHNYQQLLGWTNHLVGAHPLFNRLPDEVCPYAFPLLVERGSADLVTRLQAQGIPASHWPDLPPEVLAAEGEHQTSILTFDRLLLLPVHQSLTSSQIDRIGQLLRQALSGD